MKRKTMKASWLVVATLIFSVFVGDAFADAMIVRGDININDGPKISFSVPVGLLQALKTSGISAMVENKEELSRLIDSLMGELESTKDNHLLIIKVKNEVEAHIWVQETNQGEPMRANFVFVDIDPGNHEAQVSLRLPQGIFFLGSFIGNQLVEAHSKEALEMIRQLFLAKIKERDHDHDHDHEQPCHDQQPNKEMEHRQGHDQPRHDRQPIEEMHQRIEHLKQKIDHLRQEGRHDEAEELKREIEEIQRNIEGMERGQGHEQPPHGRQPIEEMHQRIEHLKEKIDHLRREDRHDEAEGLKREVEEIRRNIEEMERGQGHEQPPHDRQPIEEMHRRIGNLKEKIDNLRREGRHDEAEGLKNEVEEIQRNIEGMEHGHGHDQPRDDRQPTDEMHQQRINLAVDNMFKAVQELHKANMHELAEQLAREAQKLRGEIHK
ncbi:MAG: hypothetical protein GY845_15755 [Planctomycetes bacterium]|nr:hypothetical protein [Planctomycetota bacterium]